MLGRDVSPVEIADIFAAEQRLRKAFPPSPLLNMEFLNQQLGAQVWLKAENLLPSGAYKYRGARYIGEFAFGVNPEINHPIGDILFDEKIAGSFHLTPGNSYDNASNGNHSAVHWDLIQIQTPEYGGGEIWFDDVLIRKDGLFVLDELKCLNPENLLSKEE